MSGLCFITIDLLSLTVLLAEARALLLDPLPQHSRLGSRDADV
jgi:hypothetical protein